MNRYARLALIAALSIVATARVSQTSAGTYTWIGGVGTAWNVSPNWNPTGTPGASDTAYIANAESPSIVVPAVCQELVVGVVTSGSVQLSSGGNLQVGSSGEFIGYTGNGLFNQTGGTNNAPSSGLVMGFGSAASGTYNLSGSGYLTSSYEEVGFQSSSVFTQSGGTNSAVNFLFAGIFPNCTGMYNLSGSGYLAAQSENLGQSGSGTFTQSGGTNSASSSLNLGTDTGGIGTYNLSGSGYLAAQSENLGQSGSGTFTQSGGTNSVASAVFLGANPGSSGAYNLSGSGYLAAQSEYVGTSGSGAFTQSGGANLMTSTLYVGYGGNGTFSLYGGSLAAPTEYVGYYGGSGAFYQSGGTNSIAGSLTVGFDNGFNGTYTLAGGSLAASYEFVGYQGSGAFSQYSGTNSITGYLELGGATTTDSGSYTLTGNGYLAAPTEYIGNSGSGSFTQYSGTNSVSGVIYLGLAGGSGLYSLSGGLVTAGTVAVGASSTFMQSGGTVGPGVLLNGGSFSYSGGTFNGQFVNNGAASFGFGASFYPTGGIINNATLAVAAGALVGMSSGGSTLDNEATVNLAGGTLAGGISAGNGGAITNNGLITGYGALTSGVGITNNAQIVQSGGNLTIAAGTAGMSNVNTISLQLGYQLRLSGSTLANSGAIDLNSSTIAGSGLLNNVSGNVVGPGSISSPFLNSGGALVAPQGTIAITQAFVNSGVIQLSSITAGVSGGSIANSGSIQGDGTVSNAVNNTGTIESVNGTLTLARALQNTASGLLSVDNGSKMVVTPGLAANNGTINLTGGVFDNNSFTLTNSGQISGYGTLRTGGLTNRKTITLTGATSTVSGPVTNASGGSISVAYNPAIFTGAVTNNGVVKTTNTTVTWAGGFTNNATYLSDPATNYFSSLVNNAGGLVQGGNGDSFIVTGPMLSNAGLIDLGGSSQMVVNNGTGVLTQTAGILELGAAAALSTGTVAINGGTILADGPGASIAASLLYASSSASTYQGVLAGAGNSLNVNNPKAVLVLSGSGSYTGGTYVESGSLIVTSHLAIADGSNLTVGNAATFAPVIPSPSAVSPVPEPGTFALLVAGAALLGMYRRRR